jgi:hypothetical protein
VLFDGSALGAGDDLLRGGSDLDDLGGGGGRNDVLVGGSEPAYQSSPSRTPA